MSNKSKDKLRIDYFFILFFIPSLFFISTCAPFATQFDPSHRQKKNLTGSQHSSSLVRIDLFIRSKCPDAIETEKIIIPVIKKFQDKVDFNLYFIAEENDIETEEEYFKIIIKESGKIEKENLDESLGKSILADGRFKSLHGKSEVNEDIRQVIMAKYYPTKYLDYLLLRSENYLSNNWEECAIKAWMDCDFITKIAKNEEGKMLFQHNIKKANELKIDKSPTLFINGKRYFGQITKNGFSRMICKEGPLNEFCKSIPVCGKESDCQAEGKVGICVNPETQQAECKFTNPKDFKLTVIRPRDCNICSPDNLVETLKDLYPGVKINELEEDSPEATELISKLNIKVLPAFYFEKDIIQTVRYTRIKDKLLEKEDGFLLESKYLNISYLLGREEKKGDIKLFVESLSPITIEAEEFLIMDGFMEEENVDIHYIAGKVKNHDQKRFKFLTLKRDEENPTLLYIGPPQGERVIFKSPGGLKEIQEDIRQLCINKYYPEEYLDYLLCINESLSEKNGAIDWSPCLSEDMDHRMIETCTNSNEGMEMLLMDVELIEELGISIPPAFLINNRILLKNIDPGRLKELYWELTQGKGGLDK